MTVSSDVRRDSDPSFGVSVLHGSSRVPFVDPRPPTPLVVVNRSDRRGLLSVVAAVLVLGLLLAAAGHHVLTRLGVVGDPGITVIGTVDLVDLGTNANGCQGTGAYADVRTGTTVTVTDETGAVLGTSSLDDPVAFGEAGCVFTFRLPRVPISAQAYTLQVAQAESVRSSRATLEKSGWTFQVNLER